jgi:hypothetical protein
MTPDAAVVEEVQPRPTSCEERCEWLQTNCGTRFGTCESDCKNLPALFDPCYERSRVDCRDGAICGFEMVCRKQLGGTGNCETALACEARCSDPRNALACNCACAAKLSPRFALDLGRVNACLSRSQFVCVGKVGKDLTACVAVECAPDIQACRRAR